MESEAGEIVDPEDWLAHYLWTLESNKGALRAGVLHNARHLLSSIECGPVPPATLRIANGCFVVHWSNRDGDCLSVSFVGPRHFRYRRTGAFGFDSGRQIVKEKCIERLRRLIREVYPTVNHRFANLIYLDIQGRKT